MLNSRLVAEGSKVWEGDRCVAVWQREPGGLARYDRRGLDVLFDIQDDEVAQHMAAFITPDGDERYSYLAKWRKIVAIDEITKKVIVLEGKVVGSVGAFVVDGDTEVTYWIRRDLWGRGLATAALAELLSVVTVRPLWARAAADNVGSARVLLRNGFIRVGEETSFAEARGAEIDECIYRLDEPPTAR